MANASATNKNSTTTTYSNVVYYGPVEKNIDLEFIRRKCEETGGSGLVIEENTIYEIDCDCFKQIQKRKAKKNQCVNPFQS